MTTSCEKAAIACSKDQYGEASFIEKTKLWLHLLICNTCYRFSKKNARLSYLYKKADLQKLTEKDKQQMKERLDIEN